MVQKLNYDNSIFYTINWYIYFKLQILQKKTNHVQRSKSYLSHWCGRNKYFQEFNVQNKFRFIPLCTSSAKIGWQMKILIINNTRRKNYYQNYKINSRQKIYTTDIKINYYLRCYHKQEDEHCKNDKRIIVRGLSLHRVNNVRRSWRLIGCIFINKDNISINK